VTNKFSVLSDTNCDNACDPSPTADPTTDVRRLSFLLFNNS